MTPRVIRSHRVFGSRRSIGWRERRRRADREWRGVGGRYASPPAEERLPHQRFTITLESAWCQPGGYTMDQLCAVSEPRAESDAA